MCLYHMRNWYPQRYRSLELDFQMVMSHCVSVDVELGSSARIFKNKLTYFKRVFVYMYVNAPCTCLVHSEASRGCQSFWN